jgi:putative ubiquitin-RnfH superfamily antitoxin RatB of RatAB toxin-antitoxin module
MDPADRTVLRVEVIYCAGPGQADAVTLALPVGTCVADAVRASGLLQRHRLDEHGLRVGVWCRLRPPETVLRDLDRVEIYRPLTVDPKEARRQRYKGHRARTNAGR